MKNNKGFTLLELLTVISIMSLLANSAFVATNIARAKARDAKRLHDIAQIRNALEMYYDDYGQYPPIPDSADDKSVVISSYTSGDRDWNILGNQLTNYIDPLPVDPINRGLDGDNISAMFNRDIDGYAYFYSNMIESGTDHFGLPGNQQTYDLLARLETDNPNICKYKKWLVHSFNIYGARFSEGDNWCDSKFNFPDGTGDYTGAHIYADH